jgi:hypothetical protein
MVNMNGADMSGLLGLLVFAVLCGGIIVFWFGMMAIGMMVGVSIIVIGAVAEYLAGSRK